MAMMQAALAVAHLLDLAQIQYVFDTVRTLLDVARAKSLGYTHRTQVTDNPLLREKQRYSNLSISDTCTVLGAFLEMAVRSIRGKLENADHAKYLWGWIWETNTRDLPLSRGAPTLKAAVDELFDTFLPNVVRSVVTNFNGQEWKEPEVVAAEANRQAEQSRALAQTAELLQAMMSRGLNGPVMLQDGVAGDPVVIPAPAAPRVNIEASSSSVGQSNSSNVVSANSGSDQFVSGVHAQMNLSENLNGRYAATTAATVASLNAQTTSSTTAAATSSTATAAPAATHVAGHYIPAGKETATDTNTSNTATASGTASSSAGANSLSSANIEELEGFLLGEESQFPAASQMPSSSAAASSSVVVEQQSANIPVVVETKAKGKKGNKGAKKGAGKVNKRQGDGAEKGVEKAAKQGMDELDGM
eukprot:CAMPEP_0178990148 /NCGR_PEP_ID=MMETSP0795-20121207/4769_1 /TAXON_ID=88552 /ORGANISM="Amoebophrya sp., Strain Ameob2" /LENGTH=416 /DNA_ID=CAMNT_0020681629 /DNA_START=1 /DNA_END=1251 /DNA_ORIENTATION=+